jgi:Protein of unknown function (DUF1161)
MNHPRKIIVHIATSADGYIARPDGDAEPLVCSVVIRHPNHGGHIMKLLAAIGVLLFVSVPAHAQAAKPCEELKDEIAKKLDAKGVKGYTLEIVAKDKDVEGKIVGTCDGGTKKILYNRTSAPAETPAEEIPKP